MSRIDQLIDFLYERNVLGIQSSPWPTSGENDIVLPLDYQLIFGGGRRNSRKPDYSSDWQDDYIFNEEFFDPWDEMDFPIDHEDLMDFENQIGTGYTPPPLAGEEQDNGQRDPIKMDICAWYQPIHFHGYDWGIYIREDCIIRQRNHIASCLPPRFQSLPHHLLIRLYRSCYRASFAIYLLHEQYHHKTECLGIRLHVSAGQNCYLPYFNNVYLKEKGKDSHLEEALANAYIFRRISSSPYKDWFGLSVLQATLDFLRLSIPLQPPGYRKALDYKTQKLFNEGENLLQCQIHEASRNPSQSPSEWDLAPNMIESFFPWKTTLYTVLPASSPRSRIWTYLQPAPSCSSRELIKLCMSLGWSEVAGGKGSHVKLKRPGAQRPIIIPGNRKRLALGTLNSTIKALNIGSLRELPNMLDQV